MVNTVKRQTVLLTIINGVVRALGLMLRVVLSRTLGAELMGVAELAQSVHMLAITPLTSGLPAAVSRLTAKVESEKRFMPMLAGLSLVRLASLFLIPLLLAFSVPLARCLGDIRVLPSLWFAAPCVMILGYSAVYNGYCYGLERGWIPAVSELIEQISRLLICLLLLRTLRSLTAPWLAAVPVAAMMLAELAGLIFVTCLVRVVSQKDIQLWRKAVFRLAAPTTLTRVVQTALRSVTAVLIPLMLQASGLMAAEATMRLGMYNGMVMPILMLPCVFTSALSMVALPRLAKAEESPKVLRRLLLQCGYACLPVAILCSVVVWMSAPFLAHKLFHVPELVELFRFSAPLSALFALGHVLGGVIAALGQQKRAMFGAIPIALMTLLLTCLLTQMPILRLRGVIIAQAVGQLLTLLWNVGMLAWWRAKKTGVKHVSNKAAGVVPSPNSEG